MSRQTETIGDSMRIRCFEMSKRVFLSGIAVLLMAIGLTVPSTVLADENGPVVSVNSGPALVTNSDAATIDFTTEAGATTECRLDSTEEAAWESCVAPVELTALNEGEHHFEIRATDEEEVRGPVAALLWRVDLTAPVLAITSGPVAHTTSTSASVEFTVDDPTATVECRLDSASELDWTGCSSPFTAGSLSDGDHSLEIRATDAAGNTSDIARHDWAVDTTLPTVTIGSAPAVNSNSIRAEFTFSADESDVTFECRLDPDAESEWVSCTSPVNRNDLADSPHRFEVRATDQAGNTGPVAEHEWTVTTVRPTATITGAPADPTDQATASFTFESDNPTATFECRVDPDEETAWEACVSPFELVDLAHGDHRLEVRATDLDQGTGPATDFEWSVDLITPTVELTGTPAVISGTADPVFAFEASEPDTIAECRLDPVDENSTWTACVSPTAYTGLTEGEHRFEVRVTDPVGHVSTPVAYEWTVETTPPDVTIHSGPESPTTEIYASFTFSSSNQNASFECRIDGGAWSECETGVDYDQLDDGTHEFEVRSVGQGAGPGAIEARTWFVDTIVPTVSITDGPKQVTNETNAGFAFEASKPGYSFRCQLDAEPAGSCASPADYMDLEAGPHQFTVELLDDDDQVVDSATRSWNVLAERPVATILSGPTGTIAADSALFVFESDLDGAEFECSLDGGAWETCNSPDGYSGLVDGPHTFAVRAGLPGSAAGVEAERSWTIDTTAPEVTISGGPAGLTTSDQATFGVQSDDPSANLTCSLDGGAWTPCGPQAGFSGLTDGSHVLRVRATDAAGNSGSARHDWSVDRTAPVVTLNAAPDTVTTAKTARFAFVADDPAADFECQVDDGEWKTCTSAYEVTELSVGPHRFSVRASDRAGNVATPVAHEWQIVITPPQGLVPSIELLGKAKLNRDGATQIGNVICPEGRCRISGSKRVTIQLKGRKLVAGIHGPRRFYRAAKTPVTLITTAKIRQAIAKTGRAKVKVTLTVESDNGKRSKVTKTIQISGR